MRSFKLVRVLRTASLMLARAFGLEGCGSVALQPGGTAGTGAGAAGHGGAGEAGGGTSGTAGSPGTVTLRLNLPSSTFFCDVSCGGVAPHISIYTVGKQRVPIEIPSCLTMCTDQCQPVSCPVGGACLLTGVAVSGAELKWDGRSYPTSTCGAGVACYQPTFVPAGQYIARMCATPGVLTSLNPEASSVVCNATGPQECVEVVFNLPSNGVVEGALPDNNSCVPIRAADYDQSCAVDSDCVNEPEGNFCGTVNMCTDCPGAAISVKAQRQYEGDLAKNTPNPVTCPCPLPPSAFCNNGQCRPGFLPR
jgi:hypothetical protein